MSRIITVLLFAALLTAWPGSALSKGPLAEPDDSPDPRGLTVTASDVARVKKPATLSNETIARAVEAARPKAVARAVAQARVRAGALARAAGLTLGALQAIRDRNPGGDENTFYRTTYCHAGRPSGQPRCSAPSFAAAAITVTFATSETSAAVGAGRAVIAAGSATAPVKPAKRRSSASIREAIIRARLAAVPDAFATARQRAEQVGHAGGMELGTPFAIAEVPRPFYDDIAFGRFGPGRYCGTFRGVRVRRDPATGRRRVIRLAPRRICSAPPETYVAFRVTYLPR